MNLIEAKKILKENDYELFMGKKLSEAYHYLERKGYLLEDDEENTENVDNTNSNNDNNENEEKNNTKINNNKAELQKKYGVNSGIELQNTFKNIVARIKKMPKLEQCVEYLNGLTDQQARILALGFGTGKNKITPTVNENATVKVTDLLPTQNEIDITKSLAFPLNIKPSGITKMLNGNNIKVGKGEGTPIITYKGKYIIDGHHRWSQVYLLNPNATMVAVDFSTVGAKNEKPIDALKDFQGAIAATFADTKPKGSDKRVPSSTVKPGDFNLFNWVKKGTDFKNWVLSCMKGTAKGIEKGSDKTEEVTKIFSEFFKKEYDANKVADYIVNNGNKMAENNRPVPGAPSRGVMPQTDVGSGLETAKTGLTDI